MATTTTRPTGGATNPGRGALQAIFAVFLGLMIAAVVGVGVYTFMPNPADAVQEQLDDLYDQRNAIQGCSEFSGCKPGEQLTDAERAQLAAIDAQERELRDEQQREQGSWAQRTSIVLIVIATTLLVVSLLLGEALTVLSNGILLGGLFTMLYGVGWGIASGNSLTRFLVLVAALLVSLALGYLTFVRRRRPAAATAGDAGGGPVDVASGDAGAGTAEVAALTRRVEALEERLAAAAALLGERPREP
ncbi:MAG: hypothetical protein MUD13_10225 [Candidatus Nanopelagicales bacterium]|jgi:hypothetical protein|nr:hypothetical protein [Candidatus Nanopelagicales bacterium]